jgi:hypothetical protein
MNAWTIGSAELVKALKKMWDADRNHRYRLNQAWSLPRLVEAVPDYHGKHVTIEDSVITIQPNDVSDGCTLAPDKVGQWILVEAALAHDAIYDEIEQIAEAWRWKPARVRAWADDVFFAIARARAPHWLARIYWHAIRVFGGIAHAVGRLTAVAILCGVAAGCGGCGTPGDPFDGGEIDPADYERIEK